MSTWHLKDGIFGLWLSNACDFRLGQAETAQTQKIERGKEERKIIGGRGSTPLGILGTTMPFRAFVSGFRLFPEKMCN